MGWVGGGSWLWIGGLPTGERAVNKTRSGSSRWIAPTLMGDVYMTRCLSRKAIAMAYSATTVLPALVCAATSTDSRRSCRRRRRGRRFVCGGGALVRWGPGAELARRQPQARSSGFPAQHRFAAAAPCAGTRRAHTCGNRHACVRAARGALVAHGRPCGGAPGTRWMSVGRGPAQRGTPWPCPPCTQGCPACLRARVRCRPVRQ